MEVDVVAARGVRVEADRLADDEGDGFGFCFTDAARGLPAMRLMEEFVCELVREGCELLSGRQSWEEGDVRSAGAPVSGSDAP